MESRIKSNHEEHRRRPRRNHKHGHSSAVPAPMAQSRPREARGENPTLLQESMDEIGQIRSKLQDVLTDLERLLGILAEMEQVKGASDEELRPLREALRELNREKP